MLSFCTAGILPERIHQRCNGKLRVDDQSPVLDYGKRKHYIPLLLSIAIRVSIKPPTFLAAVPSAEVAGILPKGSTKDTDQKRPVRRSIARSLPDFLWIKHILPTFYITATSMLFEYRHKPRPFQMLWASAAAAGILPERIHQRCTDQEPSVLTINRPLPGFARKHYHITTLLQAQLFEYRHKPPTLSAAATFGS
jgi:hypothetical protein